MNWNQYAGGQRLCCNWQRDETWCDKVSVLLTLTEYSLDVLLPVSAPAWAVCCVRWAEDVLGWRGSGWGCVPWRVKLPLRCQHLKWTVLEVLISLSPTQPLLRLLGKQQDDPIVWPGRSSWHRVWPGPALALGNTWGVNQWIDSDFPSLLVSCKERNLNKKRLLGLHPWNVTMAYSILKLMLTTLMVLLWWLTRIMPGI